MQQRRRRGIFTAREIIYYADKRVRHEEIVSLDDRLEYILEHYGLGDPGHASADQGKFCQVRANLSSIFSTSCRLRRTS